MGLSFRSGQTIVNTEATNLLRGIYMTLLCGYVFGLLFVSQFGFVTLRRERAAVMMMARS